MAERYITTRRGGEPLAGADPLELEGLVFFQIWSKKFQPYGTLADGDTLYIREPSNGGDRLVWEVRARRVVSDEVSSRWEVFRRLQDLYGLNPEDLNLGEYVLEKANEAGYLLAWSMDVIAPLDVPLPAGLKLGDLGFRAGYAPFCGLPDEHRTALEAALPAPGRPALVTAPHAEPVERDDDLPTAQSRYIPQHVRRRVLERDGGTCRECGKGRPEVQLHIDHIRPYSRGGGNVEHNLQVLCATCNLSKGNRVLGSVPAPLWNPEVQAMTQARIDELRTIASGADQEAAASAALELARLDLALPDSAYRQLLEQAAGASDPITSNAAKVDLAASLAEDDHDRALGLWRDVANSDLDGLASRAAAALAWELFETDAEEALRFARAAADAEDRATAAEATRALILLNYDEGDLDQWQTVLESDDPDLRADAAIAIAEILEGEPGFEDQVTHHARIALASRSQEVVEQALALVEIRASD